MRYTLLKYVIALLLVIGTTSVSAQVTVDVNIDTLTLLVGQQARITLDVSCASNAKLQMPTFKKGEMLTQGVEIVEINPLDTQQLNDGSRMLVSQCYTVTSFDSACYYIPPFVIRVNDSVYKSKNLALNVLTVPIDTVHTDRFFGPKDIMEPPFSWFDWAGIWWLSIALLCLTVLFIYLYVRNRDNKPVIKIIKRVPKIPPHKLAMQEINKIKAEKKWAEEDSKEYYTLLTATLRTYIQDRYGFNALEMTSTEIIDNLLQRKDDTALDELKNLFYTADLVKFAKYNTLINENDMNLVNAIEFINQTKVENDSNILPQKEEITVEEKRSRTYVIVLRTGMLVVFVCIMGLLLKIGWSVYQLLRF